MPGTTAGRLRAVVGQAAGYALAANRQIEPAGLDRALTENPVKDRPSLERVEWNEMVVSDSAQQDLEAAGSAARRPQPHALARS